MTRPKRIVRLRDEDDPPRHFTLSAEDGGRPAVCVALTTDCECYRCESEPAVAWVMLSNDAVALCRSCAVLVADALDAAAEMGEAQ